MNLSCRPLSCPFNVVHNTGVIHWTLISRFWSKLWHFSSYFQFIWGLVTACCEAYCPQSLKCLHFSCVSSPFTQPVQAGNAAPLFRLTILSKRYEHRMGGDCCSAIKPAAAKLDSLQVAVGSKKASHLISVKMVKQTRAFWHAATSFHSFWPGFDEQQSSVFANTTHWA